MESLFEDYGIEILKRNTKYYLRADFGEIVGRFIDVEISKDEADKAQKSSKDASEVIAALDRANRIKA